LCKYFSLRSSVVNQSVSSVWKVGNRKKLKQYKNFHSQFVKECRKIRVPLTLRHSFTNWVWKFISGSEATFAYSILSTSREKFAWQHRAINFWSNDIYRRYTQFSVSKKWTFYKAALVKLQWCSITYALTCYIEWHDVYCYFLRFFAILKFALLNFLYNQCTLFYKKNFLSFFYFLHLNRK